MLRVPFTEMINEFQRVLLSNGFTQERAALCARLFAEASRDGVYSHGLNRFPLFVQYIKEGHVRVHEQPVKTGGFGSMESWDGQFGPGNLNAHFSMNRAVELAKEQGMGCVALRNTNHWMRAGSYGWQAADAGCIGICWTNTMPNMPPWGSKESKVGNNPLVIAIPRKEGHLVLDIAMSQFSYGQLQNYSLREDLLPVDGGFGLSGELTRDPDAILQSRRPLPIGYWKGSGLSLMLDLVAVMLSGGQSTYDIGRNSEAETGSSQVFLAFDLNKLPDSHLLNQRLAEIVADLQGAEPAEAGGSIRYPGEGTFRIRQENLELGVPVEPSIWQQVLEL